MSTMNATSATTTVSRSLLEPDIQAYPLGRALPALWAFISLVSAYDVYLSFKYADFLRHLERNPVGLWLLRLDSGSPALFMAVKVLSTLLVLLTLLLLQRSHLRLSWIATVSISVFQLWLTLFLTFA